jgi:hypothetical protein
LNEANDKLVLDTVAISIYIGNNNRSGDGLWACIGVFKLNGFYYFCHISRAKSTWGFADD